MVVRSSCSPSIWFTRHSRAAPYRTSIVFVGSGCFLGHPSCVCQIQPGRSESGSARRRTLARVNQRYCDFEIHASAIVALGCPHKSSDQRPFLCPDIINAWLGLSDGEPISSACALPVPGSPFSYLLNSRVSDVSDNQLNRGSIQMPMPNPSGTAAIVENLLPKVVERLQNADIGKP